MILYLHGFNSGPPSEKATLMREYCQQHGRALLCPQLPVRPLEAMAQILDLIKDIDPTKLTLVGSSLGGYFSIYVSEKIGCKAALINPAIRPYDVLQEYMGWQEHPYTGERYEIKNEHFADLLSLDVPVIHHPEKLWLLTQTGDEVLDYRLGVDKLVGARQTVLPGGDHSFVGFADWLPAIMDFADGKPCVNLPETRLNQN